MLMMWNVVRVSFFLFPSAVSRVSLPFAYAMSLQVSLVGGGGDCGGALERVPLGSL